MGYNGAIHRFPTSPTNANPFTPTNAIHTIGETLP